MFADGLAFDRTPPWPANADGGGSSLTRRTADAIGSLPGSWIASPPSPGTAELVIRQPGDVNGDGIFNSSDLVMVFRAGEYNDDIDGNSTFEEGDWNGDGDFDSSDLVVTFQVGHYVAAAEIQKSHIAAALIDQVFDDSSHSKKNAFVV